MKSKLLEHLIGEKYLFIDGAEIHLGKCVSAYLVWSGDGNEAEIDCAVGSTCVVSWCFIQVVLLRTFFWFQR